MEGPTADPVVVEVTLPADEAAAEEVAQRALGTVVALFDRGTTVVLTTMEAAGSRTGAVTDRRSAGRRLARAVGAPPGSRRAAPTMDAGPGGGEPGGPLDADGAGTGAGVVVTVGHPDGGGRR
jgi:hypothetical protein